MGSPFIASSGKLPGQLWSTVYGSKETSVFTRIQRPSSSVLQKIISDVRIRRSQFSSAKPTPFNVALCHFWKLTPIIIISISKLVQLFIFCSSLVMGDMPPFFSSFFLSREVCLLCPLKLSVLSNKILDCDIRIALLCFG